MFVFHFVIMSSTMKMHNCGFINVHVIGAMHTSLRHLTNINTIQYFIDTPHRGFSVTIYNHNQEIKV